METTNGLIRRVDRLEHRVPDAPCHTCAARPIFGMGGDAGPCPECGRQPATFTIDIERASGREGDAA